MRRAGIVALAVAALLLAACGERPQVVRYKQGTYQGKPDTPPYDAQFKGNRAEWETALATRNQAQNEYKRVQ
jgi:major membrane immunogen (membrane-anchored lipoprotein)